MKPYATTKIGSWTFGSKHNHYLHSNRGVKHKIQRGRGDKICGCIAEEGHIWFHGGRLPLHGAICG